MGWKRLETPSEPLGELVDPPAGFPQTHRVLRAVTMLATVCSAAFAVLFIHPPPQVLADGSQRSRPHVFESFQLWCFRKMESAGFRNPVDLDRARSEPREAAPMSERLEPTGVESSEPQVDTRLAALLLDGRAECTGNTSGGVSGTELGSRT